MVEPLTPDHVKAALEALGLKVSIEHFDSSTATSQEAADTLGTELGSIVKSLCFLIGDEPIMVLGAGDRQMDDRKLAALRGVGRKKVRMARPEQSIEFSGYAPGGVPPIGHRVSMPIYIDDTLARFETVYAAAGASDTIFRIAYSKLLEVTGGEVVDVARNV
ncbi:YbaK/EbsC family protein [Natronospirillum operosum]|uniref:YbaK/EbsC family protein n=1 Tax=Natronospirillum operosum TaxID=2759953 RepID=A0A4Z0WBS4_9GAMM|nr:YbaK/EbsC family protein [Natronospirillum operosum]TGG95602.1 YbaK/EbsC family protein [Natronospirillum operosum]